MPATPLDDLPRCTTLADAQFIVLCYAKMLAQDPRNDTVRKQLDESRQFLEKLRREQKDPSREQKDPSRHA